MADRVTTLDYHFQTVGRILVYLIESGLARVDLEASDAMDIMTYRRGDEEEVLQAFADCLKWMLDEGLIRASEVAEFDGGYAFSGIQLTSKGLAAIRANPNDKDIGESIQERVRRADQQPLDTSMYTKIGEFVGSLLGGLTKSIGSG